jgi:hypothetical protein
MQLFLALLIVVIEYLSLSLLSGIQRNWWDLTVKKKCPFVL